MGVTRIEHGGTIDDCDRGLDVLVEVAEHVRHETEGDRIVAAHK